MESPKKNRIIYLDLMRAFAVLMMVQGHTVHTFLAPEFRTHDLFFYAAWDFMRGFTAPIFMFTAGVVFTYLLYYHKPSLHNNPRVIKGLKRFLLLVFIGYMLRYPSYIIWDFSTVTQQGWLVFFSVDALHLIGFGLLFIIISAFIAEKLKIKPYYIITAALLFFFLTYPFVASISWKDFLPLPIAAYFYSGTGSLFPLFPWAGYVLSGGVLGYYLSQNENAFKEKKFGIILIVLGSCLFITYFLMPKVLPILGLSYTSDAFKMNTIVLRIGYVVGISGILSLAALRFDNIPDFIKLIGRHTLLIYAVHLVILYGSAWVPSIYSTYGESLNVFQTLVAVAVMYILMGGMVIGLDKIQKFKKKKLAEIQAFTKP